jgi:hypothetical protein
MLHYKPKVLKVNFFWYENAIISSFILAFLSLQKEMHALFDLFHSINYLTHS